MSPYYDPTSSLGADVQSEENKLVNKALSPLPSPHISGLKLNADITLGGLTLNKIDSNGVVWICTDISGWWNVPSPEFADLTRGWGDGSYDSVGRYAARLITLTGSFLTQTPDQAVQARKTLIEAVDLVYKGAILTVNEPDASKSAFVRLSGGPDISSVKARGRHNFSIGLKAPDPIKYEYIAKTISGSANVNWPYRAPSTLTSTATVISNAGNTKTSVVFELTGTMTGGTITNTYTNDDGVEVVETIGGITKSGSGYKTEIDTYNRAVIRVDNSTSATTTSRGDVSTYVNWIQLYPGNNSLKFTTSTGSSPVCKIYCRSGWIG
jgi:hypothetical protein